MKYRDISLSILIACFVVFDSARAGENLPFVTFHQWNEFTEHEQEIYAQSVLESWSFRLYGMSLTQKSPAEFSAFTACAETEKASKFRNLADMGYIFGEIDKPVVAHIVDKTPLICKEYINKGDGSGRPVRLVQKRHWKTFTTQEQKIYLMGYIDFAYYSFKMMVTQITSKGQSHLDQATLRFFNKTKNDLKDIEKCMTQVGIGNVFRIMSKQKIEWKYPMPWSASARTAPSIPSWESGWDTCSTIWR